VYLKKKIVVSYKTHFIVEKMLSCLFPRTVSGRESDVKINRIFFYFKRGKLKKKYGNILPNRNV